MSDTGDGAFDAWLPTFRSAASAWRTQVPFGSRISIGGVSYLVHINRPRAAGEPPQSRLPETQAEWEQLGWTFRDGVRSAHPRPNRKSALAAASRRLTKACASYPADRIEVESNEIKRLGPALTFLGKLLKECPDPAAQADIDALSRCEDIITNILIDAAQKRSEIERIKQARQEKEDHARLVAHELWRLQQKVPSSREEELLRLHADSAWGRAMLAFLRRQDGMRSPTSNVLDAGVAEAMTRDTQGKKTVQECMRVLRSSCARCRRGPPCSEHLALLDYPHGKSRGTLVLTEKGLEIAQAQRDGKR